LQKYTINEKWGVLPPPNSSFTAPLALLFNFNVQIILQCHSFKLREVVSFLPTAQTFHAFHVFMKMIRIFVEVFGLL